MAQQTINSGETWGTIRGKLNSNSSDLENYPTFTNAKAMALAQAVIFCTSDASADIRKLAHYVIDPGELDLAIIEAGLTYGSGSTFFFCNGEYSWNGTVTLSESLFGLRIIGSGAHSDATVFSPANGCTDTLFEYVSIQEQSGLWVSDIYLAGNKSGSANCSFLDNQAGTENLKSIHIQDVTAFNFGTSPVFKIRDAWGLTMQHVIVESCDGSPIEIYSGYDFKIFGNCKLQNNAGPAIKLGDPDGTYGAVSHGVICGNAIGTNSDGIGAIEFNGDNDAVNFVKVTDNLIHNHLSANSPNAIHGCHLHGTCQRNIIDGNSFASAYSGGMGKGIYLETSGCIDNIVGKNSYHQNVTISIDDQSTNKNFVDSANVKAGVGSVVTKTKMAIGTHGTAAEGASLTTICAYKFDATTVENRFFTVDVPDDWDRETNIDLKVIFWPDTVQSGTNTCIFLTYIGFISESGVQTASSNSGNITTTLGDSEAANTRHVVTLATLTPALIGTAKVLAIMVNRVATSDTMTGDACVMSPVLHYKGGKHTI